MSRLVGRKVKVVGSDTHPQWPVSGVLLGKKGRITKVYDSEPSLQVTIISPSHVGGVAFFADELRYLNNKKVVV